MTKLPKFVFRGSSWFYYAHVVRAAFRIWDSSPYTWNSLGFRTFQEYL